MGVMPFMYGMLKGNPKDKQRYIYKDMLSISIPYLEGKRQETKRSKLKHMFACFFLGGKDFFFV